MKQLRKTDQELCALLLVEAEQHYAVLERMFGKKAGKRLKCVYRAETVLCAARELYKRLEGVTRNPPPNVTANSAQPAAELVGGAPC